MTPAEGSDFSRRFGANVRRVRERASLSQEELAFRADLHRTAVGQLERGERVARADTLFKLACVLAVPTDDLFEGIAWRAGRYEPGGIEVGSDPTP